MLPLLAISFWSRVWLGWWTLNPQIFPKAKSTNNWASKIVLGERVWMNRKKIPIPKYHLYLPKILSIISTLGMTPFIWGLYFLDIWPTIFGGAIAFITKIWFCDRMVWLYEDMKYLPEYKKWLY